MSSWNDIKYFKPSDFDDPDFPGSGKDINMAVPVLLDELRVQSGWPIIVHVGGAVDVKGTHGHTPKSLHKLQNGAMAVDWHFKTNASVSHQVNVVMHSNFNGLGVYYDWGVIVGFHTDVRPVDQYQVWRRLAGSYLYLVR
jgi:hypothetical protein